MFHFKCGHRADERFGRRHMRGDAWPGDRHGRGERHLHGGRFGRLFEHGDLRFVILHLIAEKPRHGYDLIKAIEEMVGGTYSPSPGTIYPALTMLEEQGFIAIEPGDGTKKLYAITDDGKAYLEVNRPVVDALLARLSRLGAAQGGGPSPQILRATQNLRMALHLRLAAGPLSEEQIRQVTEALDRAARDIERA